jgi:hypothetical protein
VAGRGYVGKMAAVLVPVILLVIVLILGVMAATRFSRRETAHSDMLQNADHPTLRYVVPPGQDPALVLTELRNAGYDASADSEPGPSSPIVIIGGAGGDVLNREGVRETLARIDQVNVNPDESARVDLHRIRFADE